MRLLISLILSLSIVSNKSSKQNKGETESHANVFFPLPEDPQLILPS